MHPSRQRADLAMTTEAFDQLVQSRYSCRAFSSRLVRDETIRSIIQTARHAASWCNVQPWTLHIASGARLDLLRSKMSQNPADGPTDVPFPPAYEGVYRARRQAAGWALYNALGISREDHAARAAQSARNFVCFDAPHLAVLSTDRCMGSYALLDCGGFLAHFQLAARAHGVDTIAQAAIAHHSPLLHQELSIPDSQSVLCAISFGYAQAGDAANSYRTTRADVDDFTHWV